LELHVLQARSEHDFDPTFAKLVELRARPWTMNTSFDNSAKTTAGPWDAASPRSAILSSRAWIARLRSSIARSFPVWALGQLPAAVSQHATTDLSARAAARRSIPDDGNTPRRVQIEINADENAAAGMPPEMQTRFFLVSGGAVLICGPNGEPVSGENSRQDLAPGARSQSDKHCTRWTSA
jgi:hypothetical protein